MMTKTNAVLRSTVDTPKMRTAVLQAALHTLGRRTLTVDFEHGQWWVTSPGTGAQWSVVDCQTAAGVDYFGFEQVSQGEEE